MSSLPPTISKPAGPKPKLQTQPSKPAFVPIRPAFRPLLPKPCSSSSVPTGWTSNSEITISSRHRIDSALPTTRKGRKSVSKDKKPTATTKRRTKSATVESSSTAQLPSTISPSSLITKRRKSPSTSSVSGLATLLASTTNNTTTSTSPSPTSVSPAGLITIKNESSLPSLSPLTIPARETSPSSIIVSSLDNTDTSTTINISTGTSTNTSNIKSASPISSIKPLASVLSTVGSVTTAAASASTTLSTSTPSALKMSKKGANLMLSSVVTTSDIWTTSYPGTIPLWENSSDPEDPQETQSLGGVSDNDGSPLTASLSLMNDNGSSTEINNISMYSPDLVLSLESYLTPEPDDSEIPSYDPLEFLGPTINIF